jgi:PAS domain S-box-containing protein
MSIRAIPREHSEGAWHCRTTGNLREEVGRMPDSDINGRKPNRIAVDIGDGMDAARADEGTSTALLGRSSLFHAAVSSIPDFVYAFDRQGRFAYANPAMLDLFGLSADQMLGKTFTDLGYPAELAGRLNRHIDQVLQEGVTVEDEVFYRSPTGRAAYFAYLWGPVRASDGSVELVVGVSRDTSERRTIEERFRASEARLRAATELVGLGVYAWDPITGRFDWDERLREMWGLPPDAQVNQEVFEGGIHADDRARVQRAITACIDPAGDGRYSIEYRVIGQIDGVTRHIATSGQTSFYQGRAIGFIGAAIDVTTARRNEAAIRASEMAFRSFAENSSNLIWIGDLAEQTIIYRSPAYEKIWGAPCSGVPVAIAEWMDDVHPDDRQQVETAIQTVRAGEVAQLEYRIVRPLDGASACCGRRAFRSWTRMAPPRALAGSRKILPRRIFGRSILCAAERPKRAGSPLS